MMMMMMMKIFIENPLAHTKNDNVYIKYLCDNNKGFLYYFENKKDINAV